MQRGRKVGAHLPGESRKRVLTPTLKHRLSVLDLIRSGMGEAELIKKLHKLHPEATREAIMNAYFYNKYFSIRYLFSLSANQLDAVRAKYIKWHHKISKKGKELGRRTAASHSPRPVPGEGLGHDAKVDSFLTALATKSVSMAAKANGLSGRELNRARRELSVRLNQHLLRFQNQIDEVIAGNDPLKEQLLARLNADKKQVEKTLGKLR